MTNLKFVVALLVVAFGPLAIADVIIVPPGVNPGGQYRLAFVTSGTRNAMSSDIQDYNSFVSSQANQNPALVTLGTNWRAIGSTLSINAKDNTETNPTLIGVPIYNLAGFRVADSNVDLWDGSLQAPILFDQSGNSQLALSAWTGTLVNGARDIELFFGDTFVITGTPGVMTDLWIEGQANGPSAEFPLYAISGIITAVPEPGSLWLVGLGAGGASFRCRRDSKISKKRLHTQV